MTTTQLPENLIVDFDVYDQTLAMPEDVFQERAAALRAIGPVVYSKAHGGHWIVTRYEEIHQVLRDPETFSSYPNNLVNAGQGKFIPIELDPPEHTFYRQALQPLFSPKRMKELEPQIRDVINELIDDFAARGEAEFISEFAHELPTRVFLALMGWPLEDAEMFTKTTDVALQGIPGGTEEESAKAREDAANQIFGYFGAIVAGVRSGENTSDSLTAQIINTPIEMEDGYGCSPTKSCTACSSSCSSRACTRSRVRWRGGSSTWRTIRGSGRRSWTIPTPSRRPSRRFSGSRLR